MKMTVLYIYIYIYIYTYIYIYIYILKTLFFTASLSLLKSTVIGTDL